MSVDGKMIIRDVRDLIPNPGGSLGIVGQESDHAQEMLPTRAIMPASPEDMQRSLSFFQQVQLLPPRLNLSAVDPYRTHFAMCVPTTAFR